jgi:predicted PolB exonuclease-like 3'-5' exonuclease
MLGFPGKMGMSGDRVWDRYLDGDLEAIRNYCETDVLNTYLVFLRWELLRGTTSPAAHEAAVAELVSYLEAERGERPHLGRFLDAWRGDGA